MSTPSNARDQLRLGLCLGALGVVFGDVGTSPLYTMKECLIALPAEHREEGVLGILSLIFWAIILVVCVKYIGNILKADNKGEGGIFALLSLSGLKEKSFRRKGGLFGGIIIVLLAASLLFGESVITPSITVLSAVEGLKGFEIGVTQQHVVWIAVGILVLLFSVQRFGTHVIGKIFGPVMVCWFVLLGGLGLWHIIQYPAVLFAINPFHGIKLIGFGVSTGTIALLLGSIVLALTGVEALYADMGHFGRKAISRAWYWFVMPGLLLNYFGQGAHVLTTHDPYNPFFELVPIGWPQGCLSIFAIVAAIIASQAVISGAFSITLSAVQLGYFPRLKVLHTSAQIHGQIYVPLINFVLALFAIIIVLAFKSSESLASAYGVAVTGTMVITTFSFYFVLINHWRWPVWKAALLCGAFWIIDWSLFISTLHKFHDGGWLPVALGSLVFITMHTWKSGRMSTRNFIEQSALADLSPSQVVNDSRIVRVPGCAIFMASSPRGIPIVLAHHLKANKSLQETTVILTMVTKEEPYVSDSERLTVEEIGGGLWRAIADYGYMESPSVIDIFGKMGEAGIPLKDNDTTFYFNREVIITGGNSKLFEWQKKLYSFLSRNARPVKDYYQVIPAQVIEVGLPIHL